MVEKRSVKERAGCRGLGAGMGPGQHDVNTHCGIEAVDICDVNVGICSLCPQLVRCWETL